MEYANHLKEYASAMSEAQVAEEVDRIRKAAVRNHTPEVYKLCYSAVDLTTLSCTDSVESVTEFAGKAVKFYQQFPHLPNVASICIRRSSKRSVWWSMVRICVSRALRADFLLRRRFSR